jgi:hypothetical protein
MPKNRIQIDSSSDNIKLLQSKIGIEVDSSNNRIKSKTKTKIDFTLPQTDIFDNSFGASFN